MKFRSVPSYVSTVQPGAAAVPLFFLILRLHVQFQVLHFAHDDIAPRFDRSGRNRIPEFTVNEDFACGSEWSFHHSDFTNKSFLASYDFVSSRLDGDGHEEDSYGCNGKGDSKSGNQFDSHLRNGAVHQQEHA